MAKDVRDLPDVMAAGGVVRRSVDGRVEVAVVRRRRHGGDRVLPKGHVERGETLAEAALREVAEEAGCEAAPVEVAGVTSHMVAEGRKYVVYWLMDHVRDVPRATDGEVEEVEWLPYEDAVERLTYPNERALLTSVRHHLQGRRRGRRGWRARRGWGFQTERLANTLGLVDARLGRRLAALRPGRPLEPWLREALECAGQARRALGEQAVDAGWGFLHRIDELEVESFTEAELTVRAQELAKEADRPGKLTPWRAAAIREATETMNRQRDGRFVHPLADRRAFLQRALRIRNEGFDGEYRSLAILRAHQLSLLMIAIVLMIPTGLVVAWNADVLFASGGDGGGGNPLREGWVVGTAMLLGALGAVTSALQRSTRRRRHERIPEQLGALLPSLSRPVIGAVAALTVYLTARVTDQDAVAFVLVSAFGAGFSERLAVIAGGDDRRTDPKTPAS